MYYIGEETSGARPRSNATHLNFPSDDGLHLFRVYWKSQIPAWAQPLRRDLAP